MWKWIAGGIAAVVLVVGGLGFYLSDKIYPRFDHTVVAAADFGHRYTPDELRADFRTLTTTVEHIHPDIAAITDAATYAKAKADTLAKLDRPMTRMEFFRVLAPFAGHSYNEGHTEILTLEEEWHDYTAKDGKVPPFAIAFDNGRIVVAKAIGASIPAGAELVSLNNVPAAALRDWLIGTESMETEAGREAFGARRFAARVWEYGIRPPFAVTYRTASGNTAALITPGISADRWNTESSVGHGNPIDLKIANGVAYVAVASFEEPWDKYKGWLRDAFQKIHDAHARTLILDLRGNSGGDTRQSDELQTYLSVKQLPAMKNVTVKATPEVKAMYRTLLPPGFRWLPLNSVISELAGIQNAPDNGTFSYPPETTAPTDRSTANPLVFTGKMYLLISPVTYSTALIAAAPYKYWKRATLIGTPSSEGLSFFGDYYEFDLPNTHIQMHVSHKRFDLFGSTGPDSHLQPDIAVTPQQPDALAIAMQRIAAAQRK